MRSLITTLALLALLLPCSVVASPPSPAAGDDAKPMPAWEQLTQAQREVLIAPMRARWNDNQEKRARMYEHARRWQDMTPEQRERAHRGMKRWRHMDPEQREQARALFQQMRGMTTEQRKDLRERWQRMTPEQRHEWVEQRPPGGH